MSETDAVKQAILAPLREELSSPMLAEEATKAAMDIFYLGIMEATMCAMLGGGTDGIGLKSAPRVAKLVGELVEKAQLSCLAERSE